MSTSFQRARSAEQRESRRAAILATARGMLSETRVSDLSLNELARQTGLAKSNVLRYFESREAILLQIYGREYAAWLDALEREIADVAYGDIEAVAQALAATAAARPVFCELAANAAGVLEQNLSADVAASYKRSASAQAVRLGAIVGSRLELSAPARLGLAAAVELTVGGVWASTRHSPGMAEVYARHPELRVFRLDFETSVRELMATLITGLAHREPHVRADAAQLDVIARVLGDGDER